MISLKKQQEIASIIALGYQVRSFGLEAQARVCARRAVGIALRGFFSNQPAQAARMSVVDLIRAYQERPETSPEFREICAHLLLRVNADHQLPVQADLLAEAQNLIDALLENQHTP